MMLVLYSKARHVPYIRNVASDSVGTGLMGRFGNKGGVGLRFDLHSTSFCFVNAHFAAHQEHVDKRNDDFRQVCQKLLFRPQKDAPAAVTHLGVKPEERMVMEHDVVVWLGDLNYRIEELDRSRCEALLQLGAFDALLEHDQLRRQMRKGRAFTGFHEASITFLPTYK